MPTSDPSNLAAPLDEQLVAYLDGELDAESSRRIEELLASDPEVRRRLQVMERTWEMLDQLDEAPVGGKFTETTLEMVAVAARNDVEESLAQAPRRRRRRLWIIGGSLLAALVAGFLVVALQVTYSNRQLLADLPVLENFDEYRQVDSIEFLRLLDKENLFLAEADGASRDVTLKLEIPMPERREHIEKMSSSDKEELVQAQERFADLDAEHQQRLRALHAAIESDPDAARLRRLMQHYGNWTKSLSSYSRAELTELDPAARIEGIKKRLNEEQAREGGRRLDDKDIEIVRQWMNDYATRHAAQVLAKLPESQQKDWNERAPLTRHRLIFLEIWQPWLGFGGRALVRPPPVTTPPPLWTDEDWTLLLKVLGPEERDRLEKAKPPEQWQLLSVWCRRALQQFRPASRNVRGGSPKIDDEGLVDFFEKLPTEEQNRLLNLPGEESYRALLQLYVRQTRGPEARLDGQKARRPGGQGGKRTPPDKNGKESPPSSAP
jgi:hypothetical protein